MLYLNVRITGVRDNNYVHYDIFAMFSAVYGGANLCDLLYCSVTETIDSALQEIIIVQCR
jgi:hypothetical protein